MTLVRHLIVLSFLALLAAPTLAQSPSARTQAVFTASQLEKRCASQFKRYERLSDGGRLQEMDGSGRPVHVGITGSLRTELSQAIGGYLKALDSGWEASDPELSKARETIQSMQARMEEIGVWTCFEWDEKRLSDGARDGLDKIRLKAWEGTLLAKDGKIDEAAAAFAFARKLIEEHGETIEETLDQGRDVVDTRKHPAYARTVDEVDRLQDSVQDALDEVQGEREQLREDVEDLAAVQEKAAPFLREVQSFKSFSGTEDEIIDAMNERRKKIDAFESELGSEVNEALASFTKKYGSDRDAIQASVTRIMGGKSLDVPHSPQFLVDLLESGLSKMAESRKGMVEELLDIARSNSSSDGVDAARREAIFGRARRSLELALEIDPENAEAKKVMDGLGAGASAAEAAEAARLDVGTWDDHSSRFQGPGSVGSLASSAEDWLAGDAGWTKDKDVLAVRINGDWLVAEQDIKGQPTAWGLPIEAAFVRHSDRDADRDVAWVFRLTMVTRDNEKAPPWKAARVGSNRQMRASKIDGAGGSGGPSSVFTLVLALALLGSGVLLVRPFVTSRAPALDSLYKLLVPLRSLVGVATLGIGVVLLILSLLSPISDILPQAAAIVAGLYLGIDLLVKKRPEPDTPEGEDGKRQAGKSAVAAVGKAQDFLAGREQSIRKIEKIQVPLGVACLVLALIHFFAAQVTLF